MYLFKKTLKSKTNTFINSYFESFSNIKPTAYCSSMAPVEILKTFEFNLFFPENHAVILGAKKLEEKNINHSIKSNAFNELNCSYMLADSGSYELKNSPLKKYQLPPRPDLLIYNTNQCTEIKQWFQWYASKYNIPIFGIETPHTIKQNDAITIEYVEKQLEKLILNIENKFQLSFNQKLFKETIQNSAKCSNKWQQILDFNRKSPAPLSFIDHCNLMAPAVLMRGDSKTISFYDEIISELNNIKIDTTQSNNKRLIWCGLPVWGALKFLSETFQHSQVDIVNSIYASSWVFHFDTTKPLYSMARSYSQLFINLTEEDKITFLNKLVRNFNAQGIIFHHSLSCKRNSDNHYGISKILKEKYNIPSITFEADHNNLKHFDHKRFTILLEAFADQIEKYN